MVDKRSCWDVLGIAKTTDVNQIEIAYNHKLTQGNYLSDSQEYIVLRKAYEEAINEVLEEKVFVDDDIVITIDESTKRDENLRKIDAYFSELKAFNSITINILIKLPWFQESITNEDEINYFLNKLEDYLDAHPNFKSENLNKLLSEIASIWERGSFIDEQIASIRNKYQTHQTLDNQELRVMKNIGIVLLVCFLFLIIIVPFKNSDPDPYVGDVYIDPSVDYQLYNVSLELNLSTDTSIKKYFLRFSDKGSAEIVISHFNDAIKSIQRTDVSNYIDVISTDGNLKVYGFYFIDRDVYDNENRYFIIFKDDNDSLYGRVVNNEVYNTYFYQSISELEIVKKIEQNTGEYVAFEKLSYEEFDDRVLYELGDYQELWTFENYELFDAISSKISMVDIETLLEHRQDGTLEFVSKLSSSRAIFSGTYDRHTDKIKKLVIASERTGDAYNDKLLLRDTIIDIGFMSLFSNEESELILQQIFQSSDNEALLHDVIIENEKYTLTFDSEHYVLMFEFK